MLKFSRLLEGKSKISAKSLRTCSLVCCLLGFTGKTYYQKGQAITLPFKGRYLDDCPGFSCALRPLVCLVQKGFATETLKA